jgi:hypothetical protein
MIITAKRMTTQRQDKKNKKNQEKGNSENVSIVDFRKQ